MTILANLKNDLQDRICDIKALFDEATTFQATPQEFEQIEYVQKIIDLTLEATTKFRDIEARHGGDIETIELNTFRASLNNINTRRIQYSTKTLQNMKKITSMYNKEDSTARAQQYTTGKPSTRLKNSDTAPPTIRPAPVLPD